MTNNVFYTKKEEVVNAWSHFAGILLGLLGGFVLLIKAWSNPSNLAIFGVLLYMLGMLSSYFASTFYHRARHHSHSKPVLRQFDHAAIYLHIAGSYSPIALVALSGVGYWGWGIFAVEWLFAVVGVVASFRKLEKHSNIETICYIAMGMTVFVAFRPLLQSVPFATVAWILAEGVFYVTGAVFYSFTKRRFMHSVFHFFVLVGTLCHIIAVWLML